MTVLETAWKQRAYDGKWERIAKIADHENAYSYPNEAGNKVYVVPEKWITIGVYDWLFDEEVA